MVERPSCAVLAEQDNRFSTETTVLLLLLLPRRQQTAERVAELERIRWRLVLLASLSSESESRAYSLRFR